MKKNKVLYTEVLIAAVMINLFAIAGSIFIMNVYDRVVPNNAFDTLWVLAAGILVVYVFDFLLKNLRAHLLDVAGRKADVQISASLFEQILGMTMTARPPSAGVLASNMREFETLRDFFTSATMVTIVDLPFVLIFIGFIALIGGRCFCAVGGHSDCDRGGFFTTKTTGKGYSQVFERKRAEKCAAIRDDNRAGDH